MANILFVVVENLRQYRRSPPLEGSVLHLVYESAVSNSASAMLVLGYDYNEVNCAQSQRGGQQTKRIVVRNNVFDKIGVRSLDGRGAFLIIQGSAAGIVFDHNTIFQTAQIILSDTGQPGHSGFVFTNNLTLHNLATTDGGYGLGIRGAGSEGVQTLNNDFPGYVFERNVIAGTTVSGGATTSFYPANNFLPPSFNYAADFVDYASGNYRLAPFYAYKNQGNDGKDPGCDFNALDAARVVQQNPIDRPDFFVAQHYLDFLNRPPDLSGWNTWVNLLNSCPNPCTDPARDRIAVSKSFFRSDEFQLKGFFAFKVYVVSYGSLTPSGAYNRPPFEDFLADLRLLPNGLPATRQAFVDQWVTRGSFLNFYPTTLTPTQYVDLLLSKIGLPNHPGRADWIAALQQGSKTRATVLREIAESTEVSNQQYNRAYVAMEYYGYLRRNAEDSGYNNWLNYLNNNPNDERTMVGGFMNSTEYRNRFSNQ